MAAVAGFWVLRVRFWKADDPVSTFPDQRPDDTRRSQTRPISSSPFLNVGVDAKYVGSAACVECHRDAHKSYLETAHSKALAKVEPAAEPPDAQITHPVTGHVYHVGRRAGQLWHRETLPGENGEVELVDVPMAYTIGSGRHSRSYLFERDGFLMESPITWYARKRSWGMSPGYDHASHWDFARPADIGCVGCHSGGAESVEGSLHRLEFRELAIGCERCHGPGSLHVELRNSKTLPDSAVDRTIVHPARLSRELNEAICAQCHLRGVATSIISGRTASAFRPGLPLDDFRIDYRLKRPAKSMKVTGHLQQMRMSRCYTQSRTLTCTTCHDPHHRATARERVAHYRAKCLACHATDDGDECGLAAADRATKSPVNDCVSCHMPTVPTDIPHFAFTHHRIGKDHKRRYEDRPPPEAELTPIGDVSHLSPVERDRCLGLACLEYSDLGGTGSAATYRSRAFELLKRAYQSGADDPVLLSALARLYWEVQSADCIPLATRAANSPDCPPRSKMNALIVLGDTHLRNGQWSDATAALEQVVRIRRHPEAWTMLGVARTRKGDRQGAINAFEQSLAIRPDRPNVHSLLAKAYDTAGNPVAARKHKQLADRLRQLQERQPRRPP